VSGRGGFSDLSLLAYTGARKFDSFGIADTFEGFDRPFRYIFDVAEYRRYRDDAPDLSLAETVCFRPDPDDERDPNGVEVVRADGARLGYLNCVQTVRCAVGFRSGR